MKQVKEYLFKVKWMIPVVVMLTFMAHGAILFSQSFGIDTEYIMIGVNNFDMIGRQGLIWLSKLLDLEQYNLYYAAILAFLFMVLAPVFFGFLFYKFGGVRRDTRQFPCLY